MLLNFNHIKMRRGERVMGLCFICGAECSGQPYEGQAFAVSCTNCGSYIISHPATTVLDIHAQNKLSILLRERSIKKKGPIAIFTKQPSQELPHITWPIYTLEEMISKFPNKISDRIDRTLVNLAAVTNFPGAKLQITAKDKSLFFTQSNDNNEVFFLINQLIADEYITGIAGFPSDIVVTVKGWNRVAELEQASSEESKQVFVAMWFSDEMEGAYETAIKAAIEELGYTAMRIDKKEHNNMIDDEIIAEIKKSKFLIADFTGSRGGVYFEAGYAMGLGTPVIWMCRHDHLKEVHFDTRQYSHIVWENEDDLYKRLLNRIRATIN
jgi:nucleoside 2-deoxyribosyltransferase